jgi:hypothetical protein
MRDIPGAPLLATRNDDHVAAGPLEPFIEGDLKIRGRQQRNKEGMTVGM